MPRNKTFRKRNPKKIQKGGAFDMTVSSFPKIESTTKKKYYAYVVKTMKAGGGGSGSSSSGSSSSSSGIGGGGGGIGGPGMAGHDVYSSQQQQQIVAVLISPPEYEYKTTIIDEEQKKTICTDNTGEKTKIITSAGAGAASNLNQFVEKNTGDEVITIFELNNGNPIELNGLTITKENVKWDDYVVC
jgi:hypothetical protein